MSTKVLNAVLIGILSCLSLSLGGCAAAVPLVAGIGPGVMGAVVGHKQAVSMSQSDADTATYVLPSATTADVFVRNVREIAGSAGFNLVSASSSPAPNGTTTMLMLTKQEHFGLFNNAFISLNVTLQPDDRAVNISSTVRGSKNEKPDAVIGEFKKALAAKYKST